MNLITKRPYSQVLARQNSVDYGIPQKKTKDLNDSANQLAQNNVNNLVKHE